MSESKDYHERTSQSRSFLKRFSHQGRYTRMFDLSVNALPDNGSLLDIGCGGGFLINKIAKESHKKFSRIWGFDPYPMIEIVPNNVCTIVRNYEDCLKEAQSNGKFDLVTCFDVHQQLPENTQREVLQQMHGVLAKTGHAILSVPIESGFPSLVKNIIRWKLKPDRRQDVYTASNIWKSFWGLPIPAIREKNEYLPQTGFYLKDFEKVLNQNFTIEKRTFSPLGILGKGANATCFYLLKPR